MWHGIYGYESGEAIGINFVGLKKGTFQINEKTCKSKVYSTAPGCICFALSVKFGCFRLNNFINIMTDVFAKLN